MKDTALTTAKISAAIDDFYNNPEKLAVIEAATAAGYVRRISATQAEWKDLDAIINCLAAEPAETVKQVEDKLTDYARFKYYNGRHFSAAQAEAVESEVAKLQNRLSELTTPVPPTAELFEAAETLLAVRAYAETVRPIVRQYQTELLEKGDYVYKADSFGKSGKITDPKDAWLMNDGQFLEYCGLCDKAAAAAGYTGLEPGYCPLLIAERKISDAERAFITAAKPLAAPTGFNPESITNLEKRAKFIALTLDYLKAYKKNL